MFPYYPHKNREYWKRRISTQVGDSAASSFVSQEALQYRVAHKIKTKPNLFCQNCISLNENGRGFVKGRVIDGDENKDDANRVMWGSKRCEQKFCRVCCVDESCTGHGMCVVYRQKRGALKRGEKGHDKRACLRVFGVECDKLSHFRKLKSKALE